MSKKFWQAFYQKPLDLIPWQNTQADWFFELLREGKIEGRTALDLGCGTDKKSIALAQNGFTRVVGVDISEQAVRYAWKNARNEKVDDICTFIEADVSQWDFIGNDEQFDCIVDWANLHGIPEEDRSRYVSGIIEHLRPKGIFVLRTFSSGGEKKEFVETINEMSMKIHCFSELAIREMFEPLQLLEKHESKPRTKNDVLFLEFLMQKPYLSAQ